MDLNMAHLAMSAGESDPDESLRPPVLGMCAHIQSMRHPARMDIGG